MRFHIKLSNTGNTYIPVDYQYFIGAWVYKVLGKADKQLASFLHTSGYGEGNKRFKFFTYSPLDIRPYRLHKEKGMFELNGNEISFQLAFNLDNLAENFVKGIFTDQEIFIGDKLCGANFKVSGIEALPSPIFNETMRYSIKSPLVISIKNESKQATYLPPDATEYPEYFITHLIEKYKGYLLSIPVKAGNLNEDDEPEWDFRILSDLRSGLRVMRPGTTEETRVKGYMYEFELTAPPEIHRMGYNCGFGEKNAMGFGWVEILE
ncbi:MAG: CRISPR-associated endoribonuclease Cas6 [Bacteroidales bacterium]|nr:CRISPR-associated endoribonuclease Cas6 [Bacteroidales bacterium]